MIKSIIDARERALELAVATYQNAEEFSEDEIIKTATRYVKFLVGSIDLPNLVDDNAYLKKLCEVVQLEMGKINKHEPLNTELLKTIQTNNVGIYGESLSQLK